MVIEPAPANIAETIAAIPDPPHRPDIVAAINELARAQRRAEPAGDGEPIGEGGRNDALASLAGSMRRRGMTKDEILAALTVVNERRCRPPVDERDVARIADSICRYEPSHPVVGKAERAEVDLGEVEIAEEEGVDLGGVLQFLSPGELVANIPGDPPWLWDGYLAEGALTLLSGKPKAGKSTLVFALVAAMVSHRKTFAGRPLNPGPVVYLSEEGHQTIAPKLRGHGVPDDAPLRIRPRLFPKPDWQEAVRESVAECLRVDAKLLVVDTFTFWVALEAEREKDSGAVAAAMAPLIEACEAGLAVLLVHHERKGGGDEGEGVRGSTAFVGAVDVILEIHRVKDGRPTQRLLLALSRWDQTPEAVLLDRSFGDYSQEAQGDRDSVTKGARVGRVVRVLAEASGPLTADEVGEVSGMGRQHAHPLLVKLVAECLVRREGVGRKGSPYTYVLSRNYGGTGELSAGQQGQLPDSHSVPPRRGGEEYGSKSTGGSVPSWDRGTDGDSFRGEEVEDWRGLLPEGDGQEEGIPW